MTLASGIIAVVGAYLAAGLVFAVAFVVVGIGRVDPAAVGAPIGFRLLILPGSALLWPVMLVRWIRAGGKR
jgi:hypothetical protein